MTVVGPEVIPTHVTTVLQTTPLGNGFVRVTFGGGLDRFRAVGPDQFVYVLLPPPGRRDLTVDTTFSWSDHHTMSEKDRPVGAYYTVRHHRPASGEIDCDVFLHEPAGAASAWAAAAAPGDVAALWGPRTAWAPPQPTDRYLLVADETGIPATAAVLESLPTGSDVTALVEVSDPSDAASLPESVTRVLRPPGCEAGTTDVLVDEVRSLDLRVEGLYAWGGAESGAMRDLRRHLRRVVGLERSHVSMTPYWRHRSHDADKAEQDEDD